MENGILYKKQNERTMKTQILNFKDGIHIARDIIQNGGVVACATDTVYGLSCDPFCESAVKQIYTLKGRNEQSPLLLVAHRDYDISDLVYIDKNTQKYLDKYWPNSVTFIFKIKDERLKQLSCGKDTIAIRKPNDAQFETLLSVCPLLTSTSANVSGFPPATNVSEVKKYFDGEIQLILDGGQSGTKSSTIVDVSSGEVKVLRQGEVVVE